MLFAPVSFMDPWVFTKQSRSGMYDSLTEDDGPEVPSLLTSILVVHNSLTGEAMTCSRGSRFRTKFRPKPWAHSHGLTLTTMSLLTMSVIFSREKANP